jgi:hypothetical protein
MGSLGAGPTGVGLVGVVGVVVGLVDGSGVTVLVAIMPHPSHAAKVPACVHICSPIDPFVHAHEILSPGVHDDDVGSSPVPAALQAKTPTVEISATADSQTFNRADELVRARPTPDVCRSGPMC